MLDQEQDNPTYPESKGQLERMLANLIFTTRPKQADFLRFVVEHALQGAEITEKYIVDHLYRRHRYGSSIARRTKDLVKDRLKEYYEEDGQADLVVIAFPNLKTRGG